MKRWTEIWSSFPAEHRKRGYQALGGYALLALFVTIWLAAKADDTVEDWQSRIPSATASIKTVYLTPQADTPETTSSAIETSLPDPETGPPAVPDGRTYISLIVSGMGLSAAATERALEDLPREVTLAFSPYAENVQDWIGKAVSSRRETLLLMPMETAAYPENDPGPRALSSRFSDRDNNDNLQWLLTQGRGVSGVINLMGSRFLTDKRRLSPTFETLRKENIMFIETPGIEKSAAANVAAETSLAYLAADLQIDAIVTDAAIREQLAGLEKIAREKGYAIGIAEPYPLTFSTIRSWADDLAARDITLAPLKTVWKNKPRHAETPPPPPQNQLRQP